MLSSNRTDTARRWPRGQRFALSETGTRAETDWRAAAQEARSLGRGALDEAHRRWATPLGLDPADGVVLGELRPGKRSLAELATSLEVCGTSAEQVRAAVTRLVESGLVDAIPPARAGAVS